MSFGHFSICISPHPKCGVLIFIVDRRPPHPHLPPITWQSHHTTVTSLDCHLALSIASSSSPSPPRYSSHASRDSHRRGDAHFSRNKAMCHEFLEQDACFRSQMHVLPEKYRYLGGQGHEILEKYAWFRSRMHVFFINIAILVAKATKSSVNTLIFVHPMG